ncbi:MULTISPECIES: potassium-transporting ATPase subunit KdpA [Anaeromyxobacter]|uniref:potassium-transporting ATPase subunit KdpA n=1 Tax=Anaeromyxobacter TaxID=161492 RepID=UPI001F58B8AE|nr:MULTISPECIES: potassium-transporting ATPase subunit KdpA [unclassified Anaeromyxobacter]
MTGAAYAEIAVFFGTLTVLAVPLGGWIGRAMRGEAPLVGRLLGPVERAVYRLAGVDPAEEMSWRRYAAAVLAFNGAGLLLLYALQRLQPALPLDPGRLAAVPRDVAVNTAVSFVTNTNWQSYGGEATLSPLVQMAGLAVQNFLSAATGIAVLAALTRGLVRRSTQGLGSFWVDLTRSTLHVLLPLSLGLALLLAGQGVVQSFGGVGRWPLRDPVPDASGRPVVEQAIPMGPVASQVAIKQLGTNGGGYYAANSTHPFENPTPLTNLAEALAILLVPAALCFTFGGWVGDRRHAWTLYSAMLVILVPLTMATVAAEQAGNPAITAVGVDEQPGPLQAGGNMEGKEARLGPVDAGIWAAATTAASNGSVDAQHDSLTPLGGLWPMWLMQLGEVVFGGVGSGLYGMLLFVVVAVFVSGLMVGRTPEYLGKKIEAREIKLASVAILLPSAVVLGGTALACLVPSAAAAAANPGAHGFSELLYAFSSAANNNGSAFGGLTADGPFWTRATDVAMLVGRYGVLVPVLAMAGALAQKRTVPPSAGTLPTHGPLFAGLLVGTVLLVGALTFLPALALGPIVEHLQLHSW